MLSTAVVLLIPLLLPGLRAPSPDQAASSARAPAARRIPRPAFRTQVVAFEDTFLYAAPAEGSLIYRIEGRGGLARRRGELRFTGGAVACVHPAQYDRPALRLRLRVEAGEPCIAVCHNGLLDIAGQPVAPSGVEVVLRSRDTALRDMASGRIYVVLPAAFPRNREAMLTVAWDFDSRRLRVDLPQGSWQADLPASLHRKGGFALRAPAFPPTRYRVTRIQTLWQDTRPLLLYDDYDTVTDRRGRSPGRLPAVTLPPGSTNYATVALDMRRERSLLLFGGPDLNSDHPETIRGYAVRDLPTGRLLTVFGPRINGCQPQQGGGGMDGLWLLQSWTVPASLSWIDWNAFDRGDLAGFVRPFKTALRGAGTLVGFHDPSNALDGSLARYLRITENWRGVNHLTVHPALQPYAPFGDVAFPPPTRPQVSHTGPAGMPTQLVVRDRDRAWYEQWAFLGNNLHSQCRGYNLFSRRDDWAGPFFSVEKTAPPYEDYANLTPDLLRPGYLSAPRYRFAAREEGAKRIQLQGVHWLRWKPGAFVPDRVIARQNPGLVPFQMLLDPRHLVPSQPENASMTQSRFAQWMAQFREPPREYTLVPFWFWNDDLTEAEIVRQIDDFAAHGVYGFLIHPRIGLPDSIPFMSDRFLHFVQVAVEHAARKGMLVHLYDEGMYPSGSAAGQVVAAEPRHAARCLIPRELPPGAEPQPEPGENLVTVTTQPDGRRIALMDVPSRGRIRGVHFGQDDGQPGAPPAGDLLNPEATASFIRHVHARYYAALKAHFGRTVRAIFTDEPDMLGRGHRPNAQPWTTGLEKVLSRKLGYDVTPRLAELWYERGPETAAFRRDFRRAVMERLEETFYAPLSAWCAAHGVALTGHPSGPGDIGALRWFQLPGQDIVWRYIEPGKPTALEGEQSVTGKCSSSAALHLGRTRNGDEAFGAYGWNLTFDEMGWLTDWLLVRGVNLIWPHAFYYSVRGPRRDERPPDVGPNNTWWAEYTSYADYARRLCHLLATGRHRAEIAILGWPDHLPWSAAKVCFQRQRDFNYLEARHLLDGSAKVTADGIRIGPMHYRALILDGPERMDRAVREALRPMIQAGRVAAWDGDGPEGAPSFRQPDELAAWLEARVRPDILLEPPNPDLRYRHVTQAGCEVYFLFNEGEKPLQGALTLPGAASARRIVDPRTLAVTAAKDGPLPIRLEPHRTLLVVVPAQQPAPNLSEGEHP